MFLLVKRLDQDSRDLTLLQTICMTFGKSFDRYMLNSYICNQKIISARCGRDAFALYLGV